MENSLTEITELDKKLDLAPNDPEVLAKFARAAKYAADRLLALISSNNDNVSLAAVRDILDRAGYKPVERKDITSGGEKLESSPSLTDEKLSEIIDGFLKRTSIPTSARVIEPGQSDAPEGNFPAGS